MARYGPFTPEGRLYQSARVAALRLKVGRRQEGRKQCCSLEKKGCPVSRYSVVVTCARSLSSPAVFDCWARIYGSWSYPEQDGGEGVRCLNFAAREIEPGI